MNNLKMFCLTLEPTHKEFIKQLGYIPVGLGEKKFHNLNEWFTDKSGISLDDSTITSTKDSTVTINVNESSEVVLPKTGSIPLSSNSASVPVLLPTPPEPVFKNLSTPLTLS